MAKLGKRTKAARDAFDGKENMTVEDAVKLVKASATAKFDEGLAAFRAQDYVKALDSFNQSLAINAGDAVVHEVRALTLFASGNYSEAAVALNSLLAAAPGMDWTTLSSLYEDP